jgi:hypothetical protein
MFYECHKDILADGRFAVDGLELELFGSFGSRVSNIPVDSCVLKRIKDLFVLLIPIIYLNFLQYFSSIHNHDDDHDG